MNSGDNTNPAYSFFRLLLSSAADFIAPRHCIICHEYIGLKNRRFEFFCDKCYDSIPLAPNPEELTNRLIRYFPPDELAVSRVYSLFVILDDSNFIELIYALKYKGFSRAAIEIGAELGRMLKTETEINYDAIIPIPIHSARRRERGYNQSEMIARGIEQVFGVPAQFDYIKRRIYTKTQTVLNREERKENVQEVFSLKTSLDNMRGKNFLLIDDVLTTGATLNSCATLLLESGARRIDAATLAVAH